MAKFFPNNKKFAWNSKKSQKWNTNAQTSASGRMRTQTNQLLPLWQIEASYPGLTDDEARELLGFVASCKGGFEPFFWLDPEDYQATNQVLAPLGNNQYQAVMVQGEYVEAVEYIDNVTVRVNGSVVYNYSINGGVITFTSTPSGEVTADYRYYWKVRFVDDGIAVSKIYKNINQASFKLEVVR
jgi:hypothetical protein